MLLVQVQVSSRYNAVFSLDGPKAQMLLIIKFSRNSRPVLLMQSLLTNAMILNIYDLIDGDTWPDCKLRDIGMHGFTTSGNWFTYSV